MGFEPELILYCDNGCGAEENYGSDMFSVAYHEIELPKGWVKDYDNGDSIFQYLCGECHEEFEELNK